MHGGERGHAGPAPHRPPTSVFSRSTHGRSVRVPGPGLRLDDPAGAGRRRRRRRRSQASSTGDGSSGSSGSGRRTTRSGRRVPGRARLVSRPGQPRLLRERGGPPRALGARARRLGGARGRRRSSRRQVAEGSLVATEQVDAPADLPAELDARRTSPGCCATSAIPLVSYPYEWPFGMLKDAALLELDLLLAALDEGLVLKDASPYNVQWRGLEARVRGRRLVRAAARGRALGRVPPVLHARPLPAHAPGLQGRSLPAVAPGLPRGHRAGQMREPPRLPRPLPPRRPRPTSSSTPGSRAATPIAGRQDRPAQGRLPRRADPRERPKLRKLVGRLEWEPGSDGVVRLRRGEPLRRGGRRGQGGVRARGGRAAGAAGSSGTSAANDGRYTRIAAAECRLHRRRRRRRRRGRGPVPRAPRRGLARRSSRSSATLPTPRPASAGAAHERRRSPSAGAPS